VGSAFPLKEWSTVIIRTKAGEDFFYSAVESGVINTGVIELQPDAFKHVIETAVHKRKNALAELNEMKEAYVPVPVRPLQEIAILSKIKVKDVMTKDVKSVPPLLTINQFLDFMAKHHHTGYPVIDENENLMGFMTLEYAAKIEKEQRSKVLIRDVIKNNLVVVHPEELALDAFKKMTLNKIGRVAVVDPLNPKKLIGILAKTDLAHILRDRT
jgi:CBS domain-containing protein